MTKSFKRNPHKREELLRKLKPLIIKSIRKYYNDFSQYEDLLQQGYEVILSGIDEFDEEKDVNFLWFIKMKLKFYYLDKHKYKKEKSSSLNKPIGEDGDEILDLMNIPFRKCTLSGNSEHLNPIFQSRCFRCGVQSSIMNLCT